MGIYSSSVRESRGGGTALEQNKRAKYWQSLHGAARVTKALDYKNLGGSFSLAGRARKRRASCEAQIHQPKSIWSFARRATGAPSR